MNTIVTHENVDIDAACSIWVIKRFVTGMHDAQVKFVPADWDGEGMKDGDFALDIHAGGRGIKGECTKNGVVHSCFKSVMEQYAPPHAQEAIKGVLRFVDIHDAHGVVIDHIAPNLPYEDKEMIEDSCAPAFFAVMKSVCNEQQTLEVLFIFLDGFLKLGYSKQRAEEEADKAEVLEGKVAIMKGARELGTSRVLYRRGVRVLAFSGRYYSTELDKFCYSRGIVRPRNEKFDVTDQRIQDYVRKEAGDEEAERWFAHSKGYLYCRGSRKSSSSFTTESKMPIEKLAKFVLDLMNEKEKEKEEKEKA